MSRYSSDIFFPVGDSDVECDAVYYEGTECDAIYKCDENGEWITLWEPIDDFVKTNGYVVTVANCPSIGRTYAIIRHYNKDAYYNGLGIWDDGRFVVLKKLGNYNLSIYTIHATDKAVFIGETTRESQYSTYPATITWYYALIEEDIYSLELHPLAELQDGIEAFNQQDTIQMALQDSLSGYSSTKVMDRVGIWQSNKLFNYAMTSYEAVEHNRIPFVKYGMIRGLSVVDVPRAQGGTQLDNKMIAYATDIVGQEQVVLAPREIAKMFGVSEDYPIISVNMELSKVRYGFERKNSYQPYVYNDKKQSRLYYCAYVAITYDDGQYQRYVNKSCVMSVGIGLDTSVDYILNDSSAIYNTYALRYIDYFAFTENHVCIVGGDSDRRVVFVGDSSNSDMAIKSMTDRNKGQSWSFANFQPQSCGGAFEWNNKLYILLGNNADYTAQKGVVDIAMLEGKVFDYYYKVESEEK